MSAFPQRGAGSELMSTWLCLQILAKWDHINETEKKDRDDRW